MKIVTPYQPFFANWDRRAGRKPTSKHLKHAHQLAQPGSKNALALAMALRETGATQPQIKLATGQPHRNVLRRVLMQKKAVVKTNVDNHGHKVFKLTVAA